jgi:hypothetical protein
MAIGNGIPLAKFMLQCDMKIAFQAKLSKGRPSG